MSKLYKDFRIVADKYRLAALDPNRMVGSLPGVDQLIKGKPSLRNLQLLGVLQCLVSYAQQHRFEISAVRVHEASVNVLILPFLACLSGSNQRIVVAGSGNFEELGLRSSPLTSGLDLHFCTLELGLVADFSEKGVMVSLIPSGDSDALKQDIELAMDRGLLLKLVILDYALRTSGDMELMLMSNGVFVVDTLNGYGFGSFDGRLFPDKTGFAKPIL
jgi:hypothetical protein